MREPSWERQLSKDIEIIYVDAWECIKCYAFTARDEGFHNCPEGEELNKNIPEELALIQQDMLANRRLHGAIYRRAIVNLLQPGEGLPDR